MGEGKKQGSKEGRRQRGQDQPFARASSTVSCPDPTVLDTPVPRPNGNRYGWYCGKAQPIYGLELAVLR
jgi:hypothetical protein